MKILNITSIEDVGKIHFTFLGDDIQDNYEVSVIDENTNLCVHKANLPLIKNTNWWISVGPDNAKHLRNLILRIVYDNKQYDEPFKLNGLNRQVVINGAPVKIHTLGDDVFPIVSEIFFNKVYERDFVRVNVNDIIVDIGANYGLFSLYSQNYNPKHVFSIEPMPDTFNEMVKNLSPYLNVTCIRKSISDYDGTAKFSVTEVAGNNYSTKNNEGFHPSSRLYEIEVPTITFNTLVKDYCIDHIDFLKIDCEGCEYDILSTIDKEYLQTKIKKIALEYHSHKIKNSLLLILNENNFTIEDTIGGDDIGLIYAYNNII